MKRPNKKALVVGLTSALVLGMCSSALAATVHVGDVGFNLDRTYSDENYNQSFRTYLLQNVANGIFIDLNDDGSSVNVDDYLASEGQTLVQFETANQAPKTGPIWDGTGEPGDAQGLVVASVSAINSTTISVTFEGVAAPVEITLETALVHGDNVVLFVYDGVTYTETVNYQDPAVVALQAATDAVVLAEGSLLEADLAASQVLVTALPASDTRTLLQARINSVQLSVNNIVAGVNTAADAVNQVALYQLLSAKPFVNANVDLIGAYTTDIDAANAVPTATDTIAEIQAIVNAANTTVSNADVNTLVVAAQGAMTTLTTTPNGDNGATPAVTFIAAAQAAVTALPEALPQAVATARGVDVDYKADAQLVINDMIAVAAVMDATNQVQLLAALQNSAFARVNTNLIATYDAALNGTEITVAAVQVDINTVNNAQALTAVVAAETGPLTTAKVTTATALVNGMEDLAVNTLKEGYLDRLDVVTAIIAVDNATTEAGLLTALQSDDLALTLVNPDLIAAYKTLVDGGAVIVTAADVQNNVINAGNGSGLTSAVAAVVAATTEQELLVALQATPLALTNVRPELITEYKALVDGGATIANAGDIQTNVITAANSVADAAIRLVAVNDATTATEMRTALTAVAVAQGTTAYINLNSTAKLEVAELVLAARDAIAGPPADEFALTTDVTTEIATQIAARTTFLGNVNLAANITDMITALDVTEFPEFAALTESQQIDAADLVLTKLVELQAQTPAAEFTTITAIKNAAGL
ncbi:hypothetical protein [Desulfosporosinus nitroreducens]|uniref:hypothetical protein n=1 Tax=Desulfosporosinus nitroreducens TaxID=2018668 RepID=UPI00207D58D0|nr:hypothetical protein [Desulfosporosinus nitroreducens]MCO1603190.1 hypothetical protein [Desulfosporosinus nitroreducens]